MSVKIYKYIIEANINDREMVNSLDPFNITI